LLSAALFPIFLARGHAPHKKDKLSRLGKELEFFGNLFPDAIVRRDNTLRQYFGDAVPPVNNVPLTRGLVIVVGIAINKE
jgi:hypothetical protein